MKLTDVSTGVENPIYDKREQAQSSLSKYTQENVVKGDSYVHMDIKGTPDDNIIKPNLKIENCISTALTAPASFLASLMGMLSPFSKTAVTKTVKELLPPKDKTQYGKAVVSESKGGFVNVQDETPGNKRTMHLHPSGTYDQVVDDGSKHDKVVADRRIIIDGNKEEAIGKDSVLLVKGNCTQQIMKDSVSTTNGNESFTIDKNKSLNVKKNYSTEVNGNATTIIDLDNTLNINGKQDITIKKTKKETISGDSSTIVISNKNVTVTGDTTLVSKGTITITSMKSIKIVCGKSTITINTDSIDIKTPLFKLNT